MKVPPVDFRAKVTLRSFDENGECNVLSFPDAAITVDCNNALMITNRNDALNGIIVVPFRAFNFHGITSTRTPEGEDLGDQHVLIQVMDGQVTLIDPQQALRIESANSGCGGNSDGTSTPPPQLQLAQKMSVSDICIYTGQMIEGEDRSAPFKAHSSSSTTSGEAPPGRMMTPQMLMELCNEGVSLSCENDPSLEEDGVEAGGFGGFGGAPGGGFGGFVATENEDGEVVFTRQQPGAGESESFLGADGGQRIGYGSGFALQAGQGGQQPAIMMPVEAEDRRGKRKRGFEDEEQ